MCVMTSSMITSRLFGLLVIDLGTREGSLSCGFDHSWSMMTNPAWPRRSGTLLMRQKGRLVRRKTNDDESGRIQHGS